MYKKINRNSLGQFLKKIGRMFFVSNELTPSKDVKLITGTVIHVPASYKTPGVTYHKEKQS